MIKLFRIDDRLVHGQVATKWVTRTDSNKIYIVDDGVAANIPLVNISKALAPKGTTVDVITIEKAITLLPKVIDHPAYKALIIVKFPQTILKLVEGGVKIDKVIIGGMQKNDSRTQLSKNIYADQEERETIKKLLDLGVAMICQATPDEQEVKAESVL